MAARTLEKFGAHLRELREARDVSQTQLSDLAGLNRNYVGDVERGRRNPCLDNILKLAEALDVPPAELFRPFEKRR
jgi:transcriptional regulator with XRE-family HTH domain